MKFATIKNVLLTAFVASANAYDLLKDFSGDLKVGVAANSMKFSNSNYVNAMKAFNMMVAENACKLSGIQQQKGNYNFNDCDAHYNKAKELGMEFRGHTLVWHAHMPTWFEGADANTLKNAIVDHITNVLKHYEGKIKAWDVVNEAVDDASNGNGFQLRNSFLRQKVPDFIDIAFQTARKVSPDTKLFYNDYNAEGQYPKSESIYNFVADLKKRNIPIDGVGLQYHVGSNSQPSFDKINNLIGRYCKLGLEVHITELDVKMEGNQNRQTEAYTNALKACLGNSCCKAFLVWGVGDGDSWLGGNEQALLFNNNYQPKPVYNALIDVLKKEARPAAAVEEKTTAAAATAAETEKTTAAAAEKTSQRTKVYKTSSDGTKTIPESLLTKTQSKTKTIPSVTTVPATKTLPTSKFTKTLPDTKKTKTLPNTTKTIPSAPITKNTTKTEEASNNASATRTTKTVPQSILDMIAAKTIPSSLLTKTKTKTIPSSLLTKTKTIPSSLLTKTDGAEPTTTEAGTTEVTNGAASATRTTKTVPQSILDMIAAKSLSKTQKATSTVSATKTVPDVTTTEAAEATEATTAATTATEAATTEVSSVEATSAVKTTKTVPQSILDMIKSKSLSATQKETTIVTATKTIPDITTKTLPDTQATECNECAGSNQNNINIKNDNSTTNNVNINNNNITNNNTTNNITNNNISNTNNTNNTSNNTSNNINNYYYYYTTIVDGSGKTTVTSELKTTPPKTDVPPNVSTKKIPKEVVTLIITKSLSESKPKKTTTVSATKTIPDITETIVTDAAENPVTTPIGPKKTKTTKTIPITTKTIPASLLTTTKKTVTCTKTRTQKVPTTDPLVPIANPTVEPINEPIPTPVDENPVEPKPTGKKTTPKVSKTTKANITKTTPAGECSCEPVTVTVTVTEKSTETTAPVDTASNENGSAATAPKTPTTPSTGKAITGEIPEGEEDAVSSGKCSRRFARCGGINYKGPKCCQSGSRCYYINRWLSQCL